MLGVSSHGVFCDYLSVTFSPLESPLALVAELLRDLPFRNCGDGLYRSENYGSVRCGPYRGVDAVSLSGASLGVFRRMDQLVPLLGLLCSFPHNVTRIDLARDARVPCSSAHVKKLYRRARVGRVCLGRQSIPATNIKSVFGPRADGLETGTVYIGLRSQRIYARVYDKSHQMEQVKGVVIDSNTVRVEVVARKNTGGLRDVLSPDALFFKLAAPDLVSRPDGIPEWEKVELEPVDFPARPDLTDWEKAMRVLEWSDDLARLRDLAADQSPAFRRLLLGKIDALISAPASRFSAEKTNAA